MAPDVSVFHMIDTLLKRGDPVMDYASVQVMVVSLSAREAVENSIRKLIVTKSVILHLPLYPASSSQEQLLQLHTALSREQRPSPWTSCCPLDCDEPTVILTQIYEGCCGCKSERGGVNGLQPP